MDHTVFKLCFRSSLQQAILNLISEDMENPAVLSGSEFNSERCFDGSTKDSSNSRALVICSVVSYLFYDYPAALKFVATCRPMKHLIVGTYMYPIFVFYDSLISLACSGGENDNTKQVKENLLILKSFSLNCPQNYLNKGKMLLATFMHISFALLICYICRHTSSLD